MSHSADDLVRVEWNARMSSQPAATRNLALHDPVFAAHSFVARAVLVETVDAMRAQGMPDSTAAAVVRRVLESILDDGHAHLHDPQSQLWQAMHELGRPTQPFTGGG